MHRGAHPAVKQHIKPITAISGGVLVIYGTIAALSPLPLGAPLVFIGLAMIAVAVPAFRPHFRRMRAKWPWFNRMVELTRGRSPTSVKEVIEETDPARTDSNGGQQIGKERDDR